MDEVTVDRKTLKALGADTRINILKKLRSRRATQTELADSLSLSAPSVNEHLVQLNSAGLVEVIDTGRKWKYYALTQKGAAIIEPSNTRIWFLLAISFLALAVSMVNIYPILASPAQNYYADLKPSSMQEEQQPVASPATGGNGLNSIDAVDTARQESTTTSASESSVASDSPLQTSAKNIAKSSPPSIFTLLPLNEIAILLVSLALIGYCIGSLAKRD